MNPVWIFKLSVCLGWRSRDIIYVWSITVGVFFTFLFFFFPSRTLTISYAGKLNMVSFESQQTGETVVVTRLISFAFKNGFKHMKERIYFMKIWNLQNSPFQRYLFVVLFCIFTAKNYFQSLETQERLWNFFPKVICDWILTSLRFTLFIYYCFHKNVMS